MNNNHSRSVALSLGVGVGGLLVGAFLPIAVATADEYVYIPDPLSFTAEPPSATGFTPISLPPFFSEQTGTEGLDIYDATTHTTAFPAMFGNVLTTSFFGGVTETNFNETGWESWVPGALDPGTHIDSLFLSSGWGIEFVVTGGAAPLGIEEIIDSPLGVFTF